MRRLILPVALCLVVASYVHAQDPVKPLLKKLDSKKPDTRFNALMKLAEFGPKAAPATDKLVGFLTKFDETERVLAVIVLGRIGKPALPALEKLLTHEDELTRQDAVWALGLIGKDAKATVPALLQLVRTDPDEAVRAKAVFALTRIAADDVKTFNGLVKILRDQKVAGVQLAILEHLRDWGEPAIVPLGEALRDESSYFFAQQSLAHLLEKHQTKTAADAMLPFVVDAYKQAHFNPPFTLGRPLLQPPPSISELCDSEAMSYVVKKVGVRVMPSLEAKLRGKDAAERKLAATVLGLMGRTLVAHADKVPQPIWVKGMAEDYLHIPHDEGPELIERIVKDLLPMLKHEDAETRAAAAACMPWSRSSEAALRGALIDADLSVRNGAVATLSFYRIDWQSPLLERLKKAKGTEQIRIAAAVWFEKPAQEVLWGHVENKDVALRQEAAYIIGTNHAMPAMNPDKVKKLLVPALLDGLKSDDPVKRQWASVALAMNGIRLEKSCVPVLIGALKDKNPSVRHHAVSALRSQCSEDRKDILAAVEPFLNDADPNTRMVAMHCVSHCGKTGLPRLLRLFDGEKDAWLRHRMIECLMQHDDPRALAALVKAAENPEDWTEAAHALLVKEEKKTIPKLLEILGKKDAAIRKTLEEMPKPPATIAEAALGLAPLLKRDDLAVNRRAAHTMEQLAPLMWRPKTSAWLVQVQRALALRLPKLKAPLQAKEASERREAVQLLAQLQTMQDSLMQHNHRAEKEERAEIDSLSAANRQTLDELIELARRDVDLTVRRAARKATQMGPIPSW